MKEQLKELNLRYLQLAKARNDYSIADLETELTDQVLDLMNQRGYAKLATDQTLPFRSDSTGMGLTCAEERTTKQMWRQGWRRTEQDYKTRCDRCGKFVCEEDFDKILDLCRGCASAYTCEAEEERDRVWNSGD